MKMGEVKEGDKEKEFLITGSRDKKVIIWDIVEPQQSEEDDSWGVPKKVLKGHSHFIQDLSLSQDSRYALTASWDKTLRLWDIARGTTSRRFVGHSGDVLSVAFSPDNRQIASGGRDKNLKIWNTVGECKFTVEQHAHQDWVSCVKFYNDLKNPIVVSASWDKTIKVWDNQSMALKHTFVGHKAQINCIEMAPGTFYLASGGKDGLAMVWNVVDGQFLGQIDCDSPINCVLFSPKKFWLILGTDQGIKVWDLPAKKIIQTIEVTPIDKHLKDQKKPLACTSLCWNKEGLVLFAGFSDNHIRVFKICTSSAE